MSHTLRVDFIAFVSQKQLEELLFVQIIVGVFIRDLEQFLEGLNLEDGVEVLKQLEEFVKGDDAGLEQIQKKVKHFFGLFYRLLLLDSQRRGGFAGWKNVFLFPLHK